MSIGMVLTLGDEFLSSLIKMCLNIWFLDLRYFSMAGAFVAAFRKLMIDSESEYSKSDNEELKVNS